MSKAELAGILSLIKYLIEKAINISLRLPNKSENANIMFENSNIEFEN